jgi:hypothetical protein
MTKQRRGEEYEDPFQGALIGREAELNSHLIRHAKLLQLQITESGHVHAFSAVKAVLRKAIVSENSSNDAVDELVKLDQRVLRGDPSVSQWAASRRAKQRVEMVRQRTQGEGAMLSLDEIYAATLIQKRFMELLRRREQRKLSRSPSRRSGSGTPSSAGFPANGSIDKNQTHPSAELESAHQPTFEAWPAEDCPLPGTPMDPRPIGSASGSPKQDGSVDQNGPWLENG